MNQQQGDNKRFGGRGRGRDKREKSEFDQTIVDIARVARVVKGGRRFRFRATVVIGDRRGRVGIGIGKGQDVSAAIEKANSAAQQEMITVPIVEDTIPHDLYIKYGAAKILLKPAPLGTGIIAGGSVRAVIELAGIKNILSKIQGSDNHLNNVRAAYEALKKLESVEDVLKRRGKTRKEIGLKPPKAEHVRKATEGSSDNSPKKEVKPEKKKFVKPDSKPQSKKPIDKKSGKNEKKPVKKDEIKPEKKENEKKKEDK